MISSEVNWSDLKAANGIWFYYEDSKVYRVYKIDDIVINFTCLKKSDWNVFGSDAKDFYDNYKSDIDNGNFVIDPRSSDCLPIKYSSPRPIGCTTYFSGAGDNGGVGNGNRLLFSLLASDASKYITVTFNEDIYIKDGYLISETAPFGAYFNIEILNESDTLISSFGYKIPIFNSFPIPLNTEDRAFLPNGYKVKITVFNSDGTGVQDVASDFKIVGRLEIFRVNTI